MSWSLTEHEPPLPSPGSHLEQSFRKVFTERVTALGATVKESPGRREPGEYHVSRRHRQWMLERRCSWRLQARFRAPLQPGQPAGGGYLYRRLAVPRQSRHNRIADDARKGRSCAMAASSSSASRAGRGARAGRDLRNARVAGCPRDRGPDEFERHLQAAERGGHQARADLLPARLDPEPGRRRIPGACQSPPFLLVRPGAGQFTMDPTADLAARPHSGCLTRPGSPRPGTRAPPPGVVRRIGWLLTRTSGSILEVALVTDDRTENLAGKDSRPTDGGNGCASPTRSTCGTAHHHHGGHRASGQAWLTA